MINPPMLLSDFDYTLPPELIAQNPVEPRDSARLLVYDRLRDEITHVQVHDLPALLPSPTILVANNSKVRQARLFALLGARKIEILLLEPTGATTFRCLLKGHGLKPGADLEILDNRGEKLSLTVTIQAQENHPGMNTWILDFGQPVSKVETLCEEYGHVPLPPYITQSTAPSQRYQPVFAKHMGSAAAPTAGLHFTPELIEDLSRTGHSWEEVTLHVGLGTFLPLRNQSITENKLHTESTYISDDVASRLTCAKNNHTSILAVGTTSTRTLESHYLNSMVEPGFRSTNMFIYPGYRFNVVNALLTNFHLPKSSLLTLVAAFIGNHPMNGSLIHTEKEMVDILKHLYNEAIREQYRFYSFGDAMVIL